MKILNGFDIKTPNIMENKKNSNSEVNFKELLMDSVDKLSSYENEANRLGTLLATGDIDNIHDVTIAAQKAEIALQFGIEIKNKIMDAYKEIMRVQI